MRSSPVNCNHIEDCYLSGMQQPSFFKMIYLVKASKTIIRLDYRLSQTTVCAATFIQAVNGKMASTSNHHPWHLQLTLYILIAGMPGQPPTCLLNQAWRRYYFSILTRQSDWARFKTRAKRTQGPLWTLRKLQAQSNRDRKRKRYTD